MYPLQEAAARAEEAARLHREFMSMLRQVLDGHMDSSTFEDSCRALLGTNSYVLFTLDKLIQKFIKHMAVSCRSVGTGVLVEVFAGSTAVLVLLTWFHCLPHAQLAAGLHPGAASYHAHHERCVLKAAAPSSTLLFKHADHGC